MDVEIHPNQPFFATEAYGDDFTSDYLGSNELFAQGYGSPEETLFDDVSSPSDQTLFQLYDDSALAFDADQLGTDETSWVYNSWDNSLDERREEPTPVQAPQPEAKRGLKRKASQSLQHGEKKPRTKLLLDTSQLSVSELEALIKRPHITPTERNHLKKQLRLLKVRAQIANVVFTNEL